MTAYISTEPEQPIGCRPFLSRKLPLPRRSASLPAGNRVDLRGLRSVLGDG